MTAPASAAQRVELVAALRRAAKRYAARFDDEPITEDLIEQLAAAVGPLLEQTGDPGADPAELQRLGDLVTELRKTAETRARVIERQKGDLERKATATGEAAQLRVDNARLADELKASQDRIRELAEQLAEQGERLGAELEQARGAVAEKTQLLRELDEQHRHLYPWDDPAQPPGPCECGKPHPLSQPRPVPPAPEPAPPDPWERIRNDLKDWPA